MSTCHLLLGGVDALMDVIFVVMVVFLSILSNMQELGLEYEVFLKLLPPCVKKVQATPIPFNMDFGRR